MAQGDKEHRMVFDLRGRRRYVVKVSYAILAILMALSLFLVTGAVNLGSLFGTSSSSQTAVKGFEEQAGRLEKKLAKSPGDEGLLAGLTRTRVNIANSMITNGAGESQSGVEEVKQQLAQVSEDWSQYQKATSKPSPGLAIQVAPALFQLAELSVGGDAALENVKAAAEAQKAVAEGRPSLNSWSTLAIYTLFTQDFKAANAAIEKATKYAHTKFERETIENKFDEVEKNAKKFGKQLKLEEAAKSKSGKESLEQPAPSLGGGISPLTGG